MFRLPSLPWVERRQGVAALTARLSENQRLALLIALLLVVRLLLYRELAGGFSHLPEALCHWDCAWYRDIAQLGYERQPRTRMDPTYGQAGWAFFPVFPLLIAAVQRLLACSYEAAATVIANAGLATFVFFSVKYLKLVDARTSGAALAVFLFAYPYGFYLSIPYTESVYAALAMAAFWYLARGRMFAASGAAALLSATRLTGVLLVPIIAFRYLAMISAALRRGDTPGAAGTIAAALLPVALAPLGLFAFMLYLYLHTGDGLAFLHIQRAWGRTSQNPMAALLHGLLAFDLFSFAPRTSESLTYNALCSVAALLLAGRLLMLRRFTECWFLTMSLLLPLSHGLPSMPRYALAQPIFMVFLFDFIWASRWRAAFPGIVAVAVIAQLFLLRLWIQGYAFLH